MSFKNMKKIVLLLLLAVFSGAYCSAQFSLEPYVGYQHDLNNYSKGFKQYNTGLQIVWKAQRRYEILMMVQGSWPVSKTGTDSIFTTNPSLPVAALASNTYSPTSLYVAVGQRFKVTNTASINSLAIVVNVGICYQKITVSHKYDKSNYVILNPDNTIDRTGPYLSGGLFFMHTTGNGGLFAEAIISSPPVGGKTRAYSSYNFLAPLAVNIGYSITLSKK